MVKNSCDCSLAKESHHPYCISKGAAGLHAWHRLSCVQVVFGGAGSEGILGDLWLFDTQTRSVMRHCLLSKLSCELY